MDSLDIILGKEVFESRGRAGVRLYGEYHKLTRAEVEQTKELLKKSHGQSYRIAR